MTEDERLKDTYRTVAVTVTYGDRFSLLTKTVEAILKDTRVSTLILVDNASENRKEIEKLADVYAGRIKVVRHEKNLGSAGGFAAGIFVAQKEDADYIYLSDDDVIISTDYIEAFRQAHSIIGTTRAVLCARRSSFWAGTDVHYAPDRHERPRRYFNIFSMRIIGVFLKSVFGLHDKHVKRNFSSFHPIIPSHGWAYAGVLIPLEIARNAPLPDKTLGLYLDDIVYSWGVTDLGCPSFALMEPHLEDLEMTHTGSHTSTGLSSSHVSATKIYYETRNRVRVSLKYGKANPLLLKIQACIWYLGVTLLGFIKTGLGRSSIMRMYLIGEALRAGFDTKRPIPESVAVRV